MKRSTDRILTTHVGSLVRPPEVLKHIIAKVKHQPVDEEAFARDVRDGVKEVVRKQAEVGVDVPSDGEFSKPSFAGYITERLAGLETRPVEVTPGPTQMNYPILNDEFPGFMTQYNGMYRTMWMPPEISREGLTDLPREQTVATGPVSYSGQVAVQQDIANFKAAMEGLTVRRGVHPGGDALGERGGEGRVLLQRGGLPLRARRRHARGVQDDRRRRLPRPARPRPAGAQPGAARASHARPGKSCGASPSSKSRPTTTRCRASRRTACATTSAGAA